MVGVVFQISSYGRSDISESKHFANIVICDFLWVRHEHFPGAHATEILAAAMGLVDPI